MTKRYAPPAPDSQLHRPGDTDYLRELLAAAGLSQRRAGPLLGMDERTMRYKASGESPLTYPEQFCLEVLADIGSAEKQESRAWDPDEVLVLDQYPEPQLQFNIHEQFGVWYSVDDRPLTRADAGTVIAAVDADGNLFACGPLVADEFGMYILAVIEGTGDRQMHIDRVRGYALTSMPRR